MIWAKLKSGLSKTSSVLTGGITGIFTKRKLDQAALDQLEELLIAADMGAKTSAQLTTELSKQKLDKDISDEEVKRFLADEIADMLQAVAKPLVPDISLKPAVVLVVGVNGSGKTTTIGKMASQYKSQGHKVMIAAADTFRAAAVEQLQEWGKRSDIPVITGEFEADPASVAYKGYEEAKKNQADILLIDTAGRLHNKANLMAELQKIFIYDERDIKSPLTIIAREGQLINQNTESGQAAFLRLLQGNMHRSQNEFYTKIDFNIYDINLFDPHEIKEGRTASNAMNMNELRSALENKTLNQSERVNLELEWHRRWSLSVASLIFSFLGVGLGTVTNRRAARSGSLVICISAIVVYWSLFVGFESLVRANHLPATIGSWMTNFIFILFGFWQFRQVTQN